VNLSGVTFTSAAEESLDLLTLIGRRFVALHEIWSVDMGVGSGMAVDVESLRYSRKGEQRLPASGLLVSTRRYDTIGRSK